MPALVRTFRPDDVDVLVDLSLRAWEPAFRAWRSILGPRLFGLTYPDWRQSQAETVRTSCAQHAERTIVAEADSTVVGFAVVVIGTPDDDGTLPGDLEMIAVDPAAQRQGAGRQLMDAALDLMRDAGCAYVNVWTGGDDGHAPARAMYEASGFTALPVVHYYREL
ncbi:GNAT family N-acetyltransferase [Antribacter gilvus]|uniref:GNAT family N-acetyltransferase n=1 Tax=Antribacter gilvus TaxID=2304675 RepID=UPI000F7B60FE|nr:GNAT family N-acetyltransferase [Antribacter gilvus]